ncbi:hypothetical protein PTSG_03239 [Salpingoeca rosetta]|uniref:Uncharacterized protein n=1 Tax=Salpingoeca rosetta (strain ATCC 50818 / BSB-021) TaxID=946362 RepID=F2U4M0_SALR5|nr:uncharacterized protein PTSG_03239 [Salpingoeca rosetta]EGD82586.1 hypothetical protein PTSG_03239 [Salpingoeca rosetta]|eukprot:XP_004995822.1 hypothetical protein PTSG_03239 [Salpingoeca rosetta]
MDSAVLEYCFGDVSPYDTSTPSFATTERIVQAKIPRVPEAPAHEEMTKERLGPAGVGFTVFSLGAYTPRTRQFTCVEAVRAFPSIRSDVAVCAGKWMFEVVIVTTPETIQLGWCSPACRFTASDGVGDSRDSYAYDGMRRRKWNVGSRKYGEHWVQGDVIGCCIDLDQGTISYYRNGRDLGVAFDKVRVGHRLAYCAGVSVAHGGMVFVNVGQAPFHYPVAGHSPLQAPPTSAIHRARTIFDMLLKVEEAPRRFADAMGADAEMDAIMATAALVDALGPLLSDEHVVQTVVIDTFFKWLAADQEERIATVLESIVQVLGDRHAEEFLITLLLRLSVTTLKTSVTEGAVQYIKLARIVLENPTLYKIHVQQFNGDMAYCCMVLALFLDRHVSSDDAHRMFPHYNALHHLAEGEGVDMSLPKRYAEAADEVDRERGALIGLGLDKLGPDATVDDWKQNTVLPMLWELLQKASEPSLFVQSLSLPAPVMMGVFFGLVSHLMQDDLFASGDVAWMDLAEARNFFAAVRGPSLGGERLGGSLDFVRAEYKKRSDAGELPPLPERSDSAGVSRKVFLMLMLTMVLSAMMKDLRGVLEDARWARLIADAAFKFEAAMRPQQHQGDGGDGAGDGDETTPPQPASEEQQQQQQEQEQPQSEERDDWAPAVFDPWSKDDREEADLLTQPERWGRDVKMLMCRRALRLGTQRQHKLLVFTEQLLNMLQGLEEGKALGLVSLSFGFAVQHMMFMMGLATAEMHLSATSRHCLLFLRDEHGRRVATRMLQVFSSWLVSDQVVNPSMRSCDWSCATVTHTHDMCELLCSERDLLLLFLRNLMLSVTEEVQPLGRVIVILSSMLGAHGLGGEAVVRVRDGLVRDEAGLPPPPLAEAWQATCKAERELVGKFVAAALEQPNWASSELWQRLSAIKEELAKQFAGPRLVADVQRSRLLYSALGSVLQLFEFLARTCPSIFDESLPHPDNALRTVQVAEIALHIIDRLFLTDTFADIVASCVGLAECSVPGLVLCSLSIVTALATMSDKNMERVSENSLLTEAVLTSLDDRLHASNSPLQRVSAEDRAEVLGVVERLRSLAAEQAKKKARRQLTDSTSSDDGDLCPICYAHTIEVKFIPCEHTSCRLCISRHLQSNSDCFFCKAKVERLEDIGEADTSVDANNTGSTTAKRRRSSSD